MRVSACNGTIDPVILGLLPPIHWEYDLGSGMSSHHNDAQMPAMRASLRELYHRLCHSSLRQAPGLLAPLQMWL